MRRGGIRGLRAKGAGAVLLVVLLALAGSALGRAPHRAPARANYLGHFTTHLHKPAFGQAPVFLPDGRVLFGQDFKHGKKNQVYLENYSGRGGVRCLTCTGTGSSLSSNVNGVPAVQPTPNGRSATRGGPWIIFHSWRGHYLTIGSPGYGGMGSALWAMSLRDPSKQYQLTDAFPKAATPGAGEGVDDYHAYWSPDGRQIEYAHLNWNFITGGGKGRWDVRVAEFHVNAKGVPYLSNTRVVRPANGHWYETQWWNPDPRHPGFLYTESYPEAGTDRGAVVPQLFYCALVPDAKGHRESACKVTRLTDDASWNEQAIFTPDAKHVLFMSSRARDGIFNTWAELTRTLGVPSDYDYLLVLPIFEAGFLQPAGQEATDLYELPYPFRDPSHVRRLTHDGDHGWITPEFGWDPANRCLVWTENRFPDGYRYQLPDAVVGWLGQMRTLLSHLPSPTQVVDVNQNGVGVAPLPFQQQTQVGSFPGAGCRR